MPEGESAASNGLHMVRLKLSAARLAALGRERRLPPLQEDTGYVVHDQLAALFEEGTVQPFRVTADQGREVEVLGYSKLPGDALRSRARDFAPPEAHAACRWDDFAAKDMPEPFEAGRRLGFEVRVCPVVRLSSAREVEGKDGETKRYTRGTEVDAWLHRRFLALPEEERDEEATREQAYGAWLAHRLDGAAELDGLALQGFRRTRLVRKTHAAQRKAKLLERPDAVLRGELTVTDGTAFHELLTRGVGRHCAFGFGMLLLRPPSA